MIGQNSRIPRVFIGFLIFLFIGIGYFYFNPSSLPETIREKWYQLLGVRTKFSHGYNENLQSEGLKNQDMEDRKLSVTKEPPLDDVMFPIEKPVFSKNVTQHNPASPIINSEKENAALEKKTDIGDIMLEMGKASTSIEENHDAQQSKKSPTSNIPQKKIVISFLHNSDAFSKKDRKELEEVAQFLMQNPDLSLNVVGYTDSSGPHDYNEYLSSLRAEMITDFLLKKGVIGSQIKAYGMGAANPLGSNETPEGRQLNRRVELEFNMRQ